MKFIKIFLLILLVTNLGRINAVAAKIGDKCTLGVGSQHRYCQQDPSSVKPALVCKPGKTVGVGTCVECMQDRDCTGYPFKSLCNTNTNKCVMCFGEKYPDPYNLPDSLRAVDGCRKCWFEYKGEFFRCDWCVSDPRYIGMPYMPYNEAMKCLCSGNKISYGGFNRLQCGG